MSDIHELRKRVVEAEENLLRALERKYPIGTNVQGGDQMPNETCPIHGEKTWVDCWRCGGEAGERSGYSHHDCGEDCCACFDPEPNVRCDVCKGKGGHLICLGCHPQVAEELYGQ